MVGSQTALKAIWASLLKQPPDVAHLIRGADGMALSGSYQRCHVPRETVGTWTTKIARLPVSGGWHALVYTKLAEYAFERDGFLLLAKSEEEAPVCTTVSSTSAAPCPCTAPGRTGSGGGRWQGKKQFRCSRRDRRLPLRPQRRSPPGTTSPWRSASGLLTLPREEPSTPTTYRKGEPK